MKLIKNYKCDNTTPTNEEIREGMCIAQSEDCIVRLNWFFPYSGHYKLDITSGMTFEDCCDKLPKIYPI